MCDKKERKKTEKSVQPKSIVHLMQQKMQSSTVMWQAHFPSNTTWAYLEIFICD